MNGRDHERLFFDELDRSLARILAAQLHDGERVSDHAAKCNCCWTTLLAFAEQRRGLWQLADRLGVRP
jgi:hypothetical protein